MEEKARSIWDEVDAPKENTVEENPIPEQPENTSRRLFEDNTDEDSKTTKEEKRSSARVSGPEFKFTLQKDDNAEKKGLLSIVVIALCAIVLVASLAGIFVTIIHRNRELKNSQAEMERLRNLKDLTGQDAEFSGGAESVLEGNFAGDDTLIKKDIENPEIMEKYKALYEENPDIIGWLTIDDTVIDYPVMQTPNDEEYYLHLGFDRQYSDNGCLIMDTDSNVGTGTLEGDYKGGSDRPTDNLIIHGHTMKNGEMFGDLDLYKDKSYADAHKIIRFDSLYESREYEVIAVFYSQVYYTTDDCFKYYKFFDAANQAEFDDWYDNIKELSLFDTGVEAQFGDQFITLSCCAYHVEDGRFVVVGKRIK